jgi:hypothetical protein
MKKQALLVVAGSMLAFASCQQEAGMDSAAMQATIDSTVNARVEEIRLQMMASNDSMINALAQWKADSMIAAMKGGTVKTTKPTTTAKPKPSLNNTPSTGSNTSTPSNPKDDRFNGGSSNTTKKDARFDKNAADQQKANDANKKADRFK